MKLYDHSIDFVNLRSETYELDSRIPDRVVRLAYTRKPNRERERDRQRQTHRQRQTETDTDREKERGGPVCRGTGGGRTICLCMHRPIASLCRPYTWALVSACSLPAPCYLMRAP
jgi:hypothetical protein